MRAALARRQVACAPYAEDIIKPNDRLTSFERLEIYNRQYWFRMLSALVRGFPRPARRSSATAASKDGMSNTYMTARRTPSPFAISARGWNRGCGSILSTSPETSRSRSTWFGWNGRRSRRSMKRAPAAYRSRPARAWAGSTFQLQPHIRLLDLSLSRRQPADQGSQRTGRDRHRQQRGHGANPFPLAPTSRLPNPERIFLAVHRADNTVYFKRIDQEAFTILCALRDGMTLSSAVDEVDWSGRNPEEAMADVQKWFAYWSAAGWFCKG